MRSAAGVKVALVAVASREAAYLAEWVHHHLRLGFGPIEIMVNRSDDLTETLGRRIAAAHPQVRIGNVDHLDTGPRPAGNIQLAAYALARRRLRGELRRRDYVMYLDIDEFWTPADFESPIQHVLAGAGWPRIASFNWFMLTSDTRPFAPAFDGPVEGVLRPPVKSASRARMFLLSAGQHSVLPLWPYRSWSASGGEIGWRLRSSTRTVPSDFGRAFVTHRAYRSQMEYVALLGRGRPYAKTGAPVFKDNRDGWRNLARDRDAVRPFPVPAGALDAQAAGLAGFLDETGVRGMLAEAQGQVRARAAQALGRYLAMTREEREHWSRLFRFVDIEMLSRELGLA